MKQIKEFCKDNYIESDNDENKNEIEDLDDILDNIRKQFEQSKLGISLTQNAEKSERNDGNESMIVDLRD